MASEGTIYFGERDATSSSAHSVVVGTDLQSVSSFLPKRPAIFKKYGLIVYLGERHHFELHDLPKRPGDR